MVSLINTLILSFFSFKIIPSALDAERCGGPSPTTSWNEAVLELSQHLLSIYTTKKYATCNRLATTPISLQYTCRLYTSAK